MEDNMAGSRGASSSNLNGSNECSYSVPKEAELLFQKILNDPLISKYLPSDVKRCAASVRFVGKSKPTLPVNWRIAESASALHALEASLLGVLLERKYQVPVPQVEIEP